LVFPNFLLAEAAINLKGLNFLVFSMTKFEFADFR